jgi:hypothetical protein
MVKGAMVLMKGVWIGTLYKLLGNFKSSGCNNIAYPEVDSSSIRLRRSRCKPTLLFFDKSTQPCYGIRGWDTLAENDSKLCITNVW